MKQKIFILNKENISSFLDAVSEIDESRSVMIVRQPFMQYGICYFGIVSLNYYETQIIDEKINGPIDERDIIIWNDKETK